MDPHEAIRPLSSMAWTALEPDKPASGNVTEQVKHGVTRTNQVTNTRHWPHYFKPSKSAPKLLSGGLKGNNQFHFLPLTPRLTVKMTSAARQPAPKLCRWLWRSGSRARQAMAWQLLEGERKELGKRPKAKAMAALPIQAVRQ